MTEDVVIVGSGFSGAVCARILAEQFNKKVLILEKRSHIGGNMFDSKDTNGVSVHWYGPHIFHTNSETVLNFVERFSKWFTYEHTVLGSIDGKLLPIPFNFKSMEMVFDEALSKSLKEKISNIFVGKKKISILELLECDDAEINKFGQFVYEKVFVNYTSKQWGLSPEQIDNSVINRVPVSLSYDDRYFQDKYQYMPKYGYTELFNSMLDHPNISIKLNCDATKLISLDHEQKKVSFNDEEYHNPIIFTGALDELLQYQFGHLPYRSLDLHFEQHDKTQYQEAAVVNYPNDEEYTRITEFKYLSQQDIEGSTTILKEYPLPYNPNARRGNIPYYPILNKENLDLYNKYKEQVSIFETIHPCGRLAEYKYYNMDAAIENALELALKIGEQYA